MEEAMEAAIKNQGLIESALDGKLGIDQERIAQVGIQWIALLLRKNLDYGSSVWKPPRLAKHLSASDAIKVRMSDKIDRLEHLLNGAKEAMVVSETVDDTLRDLGAYCLLELARPRFSPAPSDGAEAANHDR